MGVNRTQIAGLVLAFALLPSIGGAHSQAYTENQGALPNHCIKSQARITHVNGSPTLTGDGSTTAYTPTCGLTQEVDALEMWAFWTRGNGQKCLLAGYVSSGASPATSVILPALPANRDTPCSLEFGGGFLGTVARLDVTWVAVDNSVRVEQTYSTPYHAA